MREGGRLLVWLSDDLGSSVWVVNGEGKVE